MAENLDMPYEILESDSEHLVSLVNSYLGGLEESLAADTLTDIIDLMGKEGMPFESYKVLFDSADVSLQRLGLMKILENKLYEKLSPEQKSEYIAFALDNTPDDIAGTMVAYLNDIYTSSSTEDKSLLEPFFRNVFERHISLPSELLFVLNPEVDRIYHEYLRTREELNAMYLNSSDDETSSTQTVSQPEVPNEEPTEEQTVTQAEATFEESSETQAVTQTEVVFEEPSDTQTVTQPEVPNEETVEEQTVTQTEEPNEEPVLEVKNLKDFAQSYNDHFARLQPSVIEECAKYDRSFSSNDEKRMLATAECYYKLVEKVDSQNPGFKKEIDDMCHAFYPSAFEMITDYRKARENSISGALHRSPVVFQDSVVLEADDYQFDYSQARGINVNDRYGVASAVREHPEALLFADQSYFGIKAAAVKSNGLALQYIDRKNKLLCSLAVRQNEQAFKYVPRHMQTTRMINKVINSGDYRLLFAHSKELSHACICRVLKKANFQTDDFRACVDTYSYKLKNSVYRKAVKVNPMNLASVPENKQTKKMILKAAFENPASITYANLKCLKPTILERLKNVSALDKLIDANPHIIAYIKNPTRAMCARAFNRDKTVLEHLARTSPKIANELCALSNIHPKMAQTQSQHVTR